MKLKLNVNYTIIYDYSVKTAYNELLMNFTGISM